MNKLLLTLLMVVASASAFAQRFSQYNTGTLFESFENPSASAFIPDSSRQFAFSLLPNLGGNVTLQGNVQRTLKSRLFLGSYDNSNITAGMRSPNIMFANVNAYIGMFKMFTSLSGKQEVGVSYQIKGTGTGNVTDESVAIYNGLGAFPANNYNNIFNSNAFYESYHQFSVTYKEKVTHNFSFGAKMSLLSGIAYNKLYVTRSALSVIDRVNGVADLSLAGFFQSNYVLGQFGKRDLLPNFKSPGLAGSLGATVIAPAGIIVQGNLKDIGFIRWGSGFTNYSFNATRRMYNLNTAQREDAVNDAITGLIETKPTTKADYKPIVGRAELSVAKKFMLGDGISYLPTAIVSKNVFLQGTAAALTNNVQFGILGIGVNGILHENKLFDLGLQAMIKTPNVEIFVGSEQVSRSANLLSANGGNVSAVNKDMSFSGANVYFGFSFKFGKKIERWRGESYWPNGHEQGPLGKWWNRNVSQ
ncbi:DUF5723 family protein [Mucilaginibacter daejeonensis]|uniref:DUF5723 family protein n=1 Tax=Mucilaginibacter daejeonensis TaxID=398049 RepID=UPI001D17A936|nr:DUF5723 family protein [Mucilaginibacter daejeonensis]UEG55248.1 DUF5723 family protein [Mucilaginibacter daejeonensis]